MELVHIHSKYLHTLLKNNGTLTPNKSLLHFSTNFQISHKQTNKLEKTIELPSVREVIQCARGFIWKVWN